LTKTVIIVTLAAMALTAWECWIAFHTSHFDLDFDFDFDFDFEVEVEDAGEVHLEIGGTDVTKKRFVSQFLKN